MIRKGKREKRGLYCGGSTGSSKSVEKVNTAASLYVLNSFMFNGSLIYTHLLWPASSSSSKKKKKVL
jgi:hypothetical protein